MPYEIYGVTIKKFMSYMGEKRCVQSFGGGNQKKRDHLEG